jgi:hypothetical protein
VLALIFSSAAASGGTPQIQFETNFYDFGTITAEETVSGVFNFKNTGDGVLKLDPPEASCDCTVAQLKDDSIAPGENGQLFFTVKLERALKGQRQIHVHSNDPKSPVTHLTLQLDYTPLYELSAKTVWVDLPPGQEAAQKSFTVARTDDKPLDIVKFTTSQPWIVAAFDPSFKPGDASAKVNVVVRRPATPPAPINAMIQMWRSNQTARPVQSVSVMGEILGELSASPSRLYWVIPDFGKDKAAYPAEALTRNVELTSVLGKSVELKNARSSIRGLDVKIVPKGAGKFEIVLKFDELPEAFTNGNVTVETSLASLPKLEVPLTIAVPSSK